MHEVALAEGILETVLKEAACQGRGRIVEVRVRVGTMTHVAPESLRFAFEVLARDTRAAGARLAVEAVAPRVRCRICGRESAAQAHRLVCAACGDDRVELIAGADLQVESFDMEVEE